MAARRPRRPARAQVLGPREFAAALNLPFEPKPAVAVAVSGGADSLALALLAAHWAKARGGRATALTVDHGLRPESAREARLVGRWLKARGVAHRILPWRGAKPRTGLQAGAREARYRLLGRWCAKHGVLHLFVAHTKEDQAETILLRLARGSGADGLAGMPALAERPDLRLLRPLLGVSKSRLAAGLRRMGQEWIEDPSNRDESFARVRARRMLRVSPGTATRLLAAGRTLARARKAAEVRVARFLARHAEVHPAGYVTLDAAALCACDPGTAARVLARVLMTVSGAEYPPRGERLRRLVAELKSGAGARTLGGCRVVPRAGGLVICREWSRAETCAPAPAGRPFLWDGRFLVRLARRRRARTLRLGPLGENGWAEVVRQVPELRQSPIPAPVRPSLPTLSDSRGIVAVPHLGFARSKAARNAVRSILWQSANPLTGAGFSVAKGPRGII